jgi:DNA-binding IclR family transcriptional regulator
VRSGNDAVCLLREVGSFPIKTLTFPPGARTPLGLGTGSLVLLAFEPDETRTKLIQHAAQRLSQGAQKISQAELLDNIKKTRKSGFASLGDRIVPGMRAIAVPVRNPDGTVAAALSVASIQPRLEGKRQQEVIRLLKRECAELEEKLRVSQSGMEI